MTTTHTIYAVFGLVVALQLGDGVTTWFALKQQGLAEGNPLAASAMRRIGVLRAIVAFKVAAALLALAVLLLPMGDPAKIAIFTGAAALFGWVTINNYRLLMKARAAETSS